MLGPGGSSVVDVHAAHVRCLSVGLNRRRRSCWSAVRCRLAMQKSSIERVEEVLRCGPKPVDLGINNRQVSFHLNCVSASTIKSSHPHIHSSPASPRNIKSLSQSPHNSHLVRHHYRHRSQKPLQDDAVNRHSAYYPLPSSKSQLPSHASFKSHLVKGLADNICRL